MDGCGSGVTVTGGLTGDSSGLVGCATGVSGLDETSISGVSVTFKGKSSASVTFTGTSSA